MNQKVDVTINYDEIDEVDLVCKVVESLDEIVDAAKVLYPTASSMVITVVL